MNAVIRLAILCLALFSLPSDGAEIRVKLSGDQEVPPVVTEASGSGVLVVNADRTITGAVTVRAMNVTVAHIHEGAADKVGPIIVLLQQTGPQTWSVPPGAKLTESQYESYKSGNLYFNVHTAAFRNGEVRGQIRPVTR